MKNMMTTKNFYKRCKMQITGMMIYYYFVCKRKLWYFINQVVL